MSKRESISRYNLIIKKLRKLPCTFDEIADYLSRESELQSYNFNVSKRTFQRDLDDIRSLFNIDIQYDFSGKVYSINNEEQQEVNDASPRNSEQDKGALLRRCRCCSRRSGLNLTCFYTVFASWTFLS